MRNKLLGHLYPAFEREPDAASVMTLAHPDGAAWSVAGRRLLAGTESGAILADINLATSTVSQVADILEAAGFAVTHLNFESTHLSALVLINGSGTQSGYTNVLECHRSVLWALIDAYATEVQIAADMVPQALREARLHSADGEWLDLWGSYFGVPRRPLQGDVAYLEWIAMEVLRKKSNKYAIENAIYSNTGSVVEILEPWKRIFTLDVSPLSSDHVLHDGVAVGYHMIRPVIPTASDWDSVMAVIDKTRPAGVLVSQPVRSVPAALIVRPSDAEVWASRFVEHTFRASGPNQQILGALVLDGWRPPINHLVSVYFVSTVGNAHGANDMQHIAPFRSVAKASISMSDGFMLGDTNSVLGRGRFVRQTPLSSLSGALVLSDMVRVDTLTRVTEIVIDSRGNFVDAAVQSIQRVQGLDSITGYFATLNPESGWNGAWSANRNWGGHISGDWQESKVHPVSIYVLSQISNALGAADAQQIAPLRSVARASMNLSDGFVLGNVNSVLGRGQRNNQVIAPATLSDALVLSGQMGAVTVTRVTEIFMDMHGALLDLAVLTDQLGYGADSNMRFSAVLYSEMGWTGAWSADRSWYDNIVVGMAMT